MTSSLRALRRRLITPGPSLMPKTVGGFHEKSPESRELLETVGHTFLAGYAHAVEARSPAEAEERLEQVPRRFRGFAYEGAGMGFAILDAVPIWSSGNVARFLAGRGEFHNYMIYVGVGWAMAKLPRFLWPKSSEFDPLLHWLVLDGYGFHQAFFHTDKYVTRHHVDHDFPWPGGRWGAYANRAIDQGIGRALWFVGGTDVDRVASLVDGYDAARHPDLYAGVGLAATYAGGSTATELRRLRDLAGDHRPQLAQGSAFAAEARIRAGLLVPHNEVATGALCAISPHEAARISLQARPVETPRGDLPAYEVWRQTIAEQFVTLGRY
ncbi:DUF1702 family protein [Nonomuraea sp. B12E4]|uniref:DUF1702 family protein n=1 Tax=Nonomuraea sp. B12E4 TaxID=3153564 RepID=UPI00325EEB7F